MDYKLPAEAPSQSKSLIDYVIPALLLFIVIAGTAFVIYRQRRKKGAVVTEEEKYPGLETKSKPETKEIPITSEMQKVIDTLSDKEKAIVILLLRNGGSARQADIRYEIGIPKSSLTGIINALKRKNIIRKHEQGRTNIIEISEWFLSEKETK